MKNKRPANPSQSNIPTDCVVQLNAAASTGATSYRMNWVKTHH